jgi:hypothetical protein
MHPSLAIVGILHVCTKIGHTHPRMHWAISSLYFFKCPATKELGPRPNQQASGPAEWASGRLGSPPSSRTHVHLPVHLHREETPLPLPLLFPSNPINSFTVFIRHQHKNYSPLNDESVQSNGSTHGGLIIMQVTDEVIGPTMAFASWSPSSGYHSADSSRHGVHPEDLYKSPIIPSSNSFPIIRNPPRNTAPSLLFFAHRRRRWATHPNSFYQTSSLASLYLLDIFSRPFAVIGRALRCAMPLPPFESDATVTRWPFVVSVRVLVFLHHQERHAPSSLHHRSSTTTTRTGDRSRLHQYFYLRQLLGDPKQKPKP